MPGQAECQHAEYWGGHPMCHRCATARRHSFPISEISRHSNGEPACAIRCTRRTPRDRDRARQIGRRTHARLRWLKRWWLSDIRRRLGLPGHISEERTHASRALRIGSKRPPGRRHRWASQSAGWGPEGDAHRHPIFAMEPDRLHPLSLALSCWFRQNRRCCDGPYIATAALQDLNPQRGSPSEILGTASQAVDAQPSSERLGSAFH